MTNNNYKIEILDNPNEFDLSFKLIIIGDSGVGKSCLAMKASKDQFDALYSPTIGFEFMSFYLKIEEKIIKLQVWDTCGQEVYRSLITSFYRNSSLAIIVYAIDDENTFSDVNNWLNEVRTKGNPEVNIFLVGNKADLEDKRKVTNQEAKTFTENNRIKYFLETSAKTGFNAKNVFIEAGKLLYEQHLYYINKMSKQGSSSIKEEETIEAITETEEQQDNIRVKKKCC